MFKSKKTVRFSDFFISRAKLGFTKLRQVFVKLLILYFFNLKYYIRIEIDTLDYTISRVLIKLILDNLSQ